MEFDSKKSIRQRQHVDVLREAIDQRRSAPASRGLPRRPGAWLRKAETFSLVEILRGDCIRRDAGHRAVRSRRSPSVVDRLLELDVVGLVETPRDAPSILRLRLVRTTTACAAVDAGVRSSTVTRRPSYRSRSRHRASAADDAAGACRSRPVTLAEDVVQRNQGVAETEHQPPGRGRVSIAVRRLRRERLVDVADHASHEPGDDGPGVDRDRDRREARARFAPRAAMLALRRHRSVAGLVARSITSAQRIPPSMLEGFGAAY